MKILSVETSSKVFSVAFSDGQQVLSQRVVEDARGPDLILASMIAEVCVLSRIELPAIDFFAVSIGPGSFTGLRVGVVTVKTLAWALKKPVVPVSTLELTAQTYADSSLPVCLFVDARKGKVYTALFSPDGKGGMKRHTPDQLCPPEQVLQQVKTPVLLVGDGTVRYESLIRSAPAGQLTIPDSTTWIPSASTLCQLVSRRWPEGRVDDPHSLVPQYLYSKESDITGW